MRLNEKETQMEEYADIYYVDNARNAVRRVRAPVTSRPVLAPPSVAAPVTAAPASSPFVYNQPAPAFNAQGFWPTTPVYAPGPMFPQVLPQPAAIVQSLLGRLTLGDLIQIGLQSFAALKALPEAPNPTGSSETDVSNLIVYQKALAEHAKRDEQLRTIGNLGARLVG